MSISSLRITDFRNLAQAELLPSESGLNIVCGNNGSGKTSILEAIHYLGFGRSFRSSFSNSLIRHETNKFSLFAQVISDSSRQVAIGIERGTDGASRMRVAEKEALSISELASCLPTRIINSQSHQLFESGPAYRRKYLDWGLFYQYESFMAIWRQFERALKQRNSLLKDKRSKAEIDSWTAELLKYGLALDQMRREYVTQILPVLIAICDDIFPIKGLEVNYYSGWDNELTYEEALLRYFADEYRMGFTQTGPHRADLEMYIDGIEVKHILSRGQQKLLICAMILAQGSLLAKSANKRLVYLVDDLPAELDQLSREKLIGALIKQNSQVFITAIEHNAVCDVLNDYSDVPMKVFHVKHGHVETMIEP